MRKITRDACRNFLNRRPFKRDNTQVLVYSDRVEMRLFGNKIADMSSADGLFISAAGHKTATTKERLNGLPGVNIAQFANTWYLNRSEWDGDSVSVSIHSSRTRHTITQTSN